MPIIDSRFTRTRSQEATEALNKLPECMQLMVHCVTLHRQFAVDALVIDAGNFFIKNGMDLKDVALGFPVKRILKSEIVSEALKKVRQSNIEEYNEVLRKHWCFSLHEMKGRIVIMQGLEQEYGRKSE